MSAFVPLGEAWRWFYLMLEPALAIAALLL
jgi:hypothetical protein